MIINRLINKLRNMLYKIVNRIDNKTAVETMTAFEHNQIDSSSITISIDRIPLNIAANILKMSNQPQTSVLVGNCNHIGDGEGVFMFPKWYMRGLVMAWEKHGYEIKNGRFHVKNNVEEIDSDQHETTIRWKAEGEHDRLEGSQIPSEVVSEMVDATALSRNVPSSAQYENLSDKTLTNTCEGCETKERCAWRREKDYDAVERCPCGKCLIKSMCKQYCDLLVQATKK